MSLYSIEKSVRLAMDRWLLFLCNGIIDKDKHHCFLDGFIYEQKGIFTAIEFIVNQLHNVFSNIPPLFYVDSF